MKKDQHLKRADIIAIITREHKAEQFREVYGRTPEIYFEEYSYKEPDIWSSVLFDLQIPLTKIKPQNRKDRK